MNQLGTRGGTSDPELWRALRFGSADITASNNGPAATTLVQDGGMKWLMFRQGPLATYGAYLLGRHVAVARAILPDPWPNSYRRRSDRPQD